MQRALATMGLVEHAAQRAVDRERWIRCAVSHRCAGYVRVVDRDEGGDVANSAVREAQPPGRDQRSLGEAQPSGRDQRFLGACTACVRLTCTRCRTAVGPDEPHVCDPDQVASVRLITAETRPCAQCGMASMRVEGCPIMWCPQCHAFWN